MNETVYQNKLVKKLQMILPGCFVLKNDPTENQGIPDILILFGRHWGMLEIKKTGNSKKRPNQSHYVNLFGEMSFAAFISPENENEVLNDLQSALGACR